MRLALEDAFATVTADAEVQRRLAAYGADMIGHPLAGWCLRNYAILTECPDALGEHGLSGPEVYWSRYYWLVRFARVWSAVAGYDAGLEQQVFGLLEYAPDGWDHCEAVAAAAERAAADQLRAAGIGKGGQPG
jgi:hypothetical protein